MKPEKNSALIVVDVQNDFCPGGELPVPQGDKVVPTLNKYIEIFRDEGLPIFFTRDWHPKNHISFKERGGPWPPHCVQETHGADFHPDLNIPPEAEIITKGDRPEKEAYSGFLETDLAERLREKDVEKVYVGGLAADYCVKNTTLDALNEGFEVVLLRDATRGVDVEPGDTERAVEEMVDSGAREARLADIRG